MIICIAGSRNISLTPQEVDVIVSESGFEVEGIISGKNPKGVDSAGEAWAKWKNLPLVKAFPADWKNTSHPDSIVACNPYGAYDKKAGMRRNVEMAKYLSDHNGALIVIWDGSSKGSKSMLSLGHQYGLKVFEKIVIQ